MIMEQCRWQKTGRKRTLGVCASGAVRTPAPNTGDLAFWFLLAERYDLQEGIPFRAVWQRCITLESANPNKKKLNCGRRWLRQTWLTRPHPTMKRTRECNFLLRQRESALSGFLTTNLNETYLQSESRKVCHDREIMLLAELLRLLNASPPFRESLLDRLDQMMCLLSRQIHLACRGVNWTEVFQLRSKSLRKVQVQGVANFDCITSLNPIRDRIDKSESSPSFGIEENADIDARGCSLVSNRGHKSQLLHAVLSIDIGGEA